MTDTAPAFRRLRFRLPSRGGEMAALEFGPTDRPVDVVFVHANGFNAMTYAPVLAPLGDNLRVLAVDQRGHGRTTLPIAQLKRRSWDDLRDDIVALLAALDQPPVVLAGHSMGGTASLMAASLASERVSRLALYDPVILPARESWAAHLPWGAAFLHRYMPMVQGTLKRRRRFKDRDAAFQAFKGRGAFKTWDDAMLRAYLTDGLVETTDGDLALACDPEWEASNYAAQGNRPRVALSRLKIPALIVRGETGSMCALESAGPKVRIATESGTSHFLPMERPDLVRQTLRDAVAQARQAAQRP